MPDPADAETDISEVDKRLRWLRLLRKLKAASNHRLLRGDHQSADGSLGTGPRHRRPGGRGRS